MRFAMRRLSFIAIIALTAQAAEAACIVTDPAGTHCY
jgi:hypothetical protein